MTLFIRLLYSKCFVTEYYKVTLYIHVLQKNKVGVTLLSKLVVHNFM